MRESLDIDFSGLQAHPQATVIVALSGGLDSTVLLHALANAVQMRPRLLRAVHVDHGLHPDAAHWQAHCAAMCAALEVPFQAVRVHVARDGDGPEGAARRARHAALADAAAAGDVIALAHHQGDQAETFLLRALRASGPDGLGAMRPWRRAGDAWLWRPLLSTTRERLAAYAHVHGLAWIEDPSNRDAAFDRNFLRLHVLPLLQARWPHAAAALAASADRCADDAALLDPEDSDVVARLRIDAQTLDADALAALSRPRRARVLRAWVASLALPPLTARGVAQVEADLLAPRTDANAQFEWNGARIRRWGALLWAGRCVPRIPADWHAIWTGSGHVVLPDGGALRTSQPHAFAGPLTVRARRGGERIRLPRRDHSHALKHVLQDLRVPPWEREHLPLLFAADGELEAAGDVAVGARLSASLAEAGVRLQWQRPRTAGGR